MHWLVGVLVYLVYWCIGCGGVVHGLMLWCMCVLVVLGALSSLCKGVLEIWVYCLYSCIVVMGA